MTIAIVDGSFERVPSVSHKEIPWAMSEGVHVLGAAGMGALRAAELAVFGMEGVGAIYEAYARGELEADDEVAVAHASDENGYRPTSEAMVNIRATLRAAEAAGSISMDVRIDFERIAKSLFYPDRCYPILLPRAAKEGIAPLAIEALQAFLPKGRVNQKRLDALALLGVMRERFAGPAAPKRVRYHFEPTDAWEHIRASARPKDRAPAAPDPAVEELKRAGGWAAARPGAMARAMAIEAARRQGRTIRGAALGDAVEAFRRARGLHDAADFQRWIAEEAPADPERFFQDEAHVQLAEGMFGAEADRLLADHLRSIGAHSALRARAAQGALLQRPPEHRPPLQSESEPHEPHLPPEHLPILQSESEPHEPHLPFEQRPLPLQSESEPHAPHLPFEQRPSLQSESEPHAPHRPPEHLP